MSDPRDEIRAKVQDLSKNGVKFDKAVETVLAGGVKQSRFLPSGRTFLTVVGTMGDEFIDPEKPYCSCSNFFFRVQGGREPTCYHLLSYAIASRTGRVDVVEFDDEEYQGYLSAMIGDVFEVIRKSGH